MDHNRKRFLITENEKIDILRLYGLISEQSTAISSPPTGSGKQIFGDSFFGNGKWIQLNPNTKKDLDFQIKDAIEFLSQNKGSVGLVQITASESQVPNVDREPTSDTYLTYLPDLELSKKRAETMKKYMEKAFKNALETGIISELPVFSEPILLIGETKYDSKNPNNPKHDKERYVKVDVSLQSIPPDETPIIPTIPTDCSRNMKIRIYFDPKEHGDNHTCNSAVFEVYINNTLVNRDGDNKPYISLNNAGLLDDAGYTFIKQEVPDKTKSKPKNTVYKTVFSPKSKNAGGMRSNTITITNEMFKSIPNIDKEVNIKFVCRNISKWIPSESDLIGLYEDIPGEFFRSETVYGTLYNGTQMTYKNGEWFHSSNWKYGCHQSVGSIEIINNEGKKVKLELKTPTEKDSEITYKTIDPCTLQYK